MYCSLWNINAVNISFYTVTEICQAVFQPADIIPFPASGIQNADGFFRILIN